MHVLIIPSWYPKSATDWHGSFFREHALALKDASMKVGVIASALRPMSRPLEAIFGRSGIEFEVDEGVPTFRSSAANFPPRMPRLARRRTVSMTLRLYEAYIAVYGKPDLIHAQSALNAGCAALQIKEQHGIPYIVQEHSTAFARGLLSADELRCAQEVFDGASQVFAVSSIFAELLSQLIELPGSKLATIPNLVDKRFLTASFIPRESDRFRFLHVSGLEEKKNVQLALLAFAREFRGVPGISIRIVGDGPKGPALKALAQQLGVDEQAEFVGALSRDQIVDAFAETDAFVLPSSFETFGVVLIEAMAMGLPVVATRCGGPEDIVSDTSGFLVDKDDLDGFASAMSALVATKKLNDRQVLRDRCRLRYGAETITAQWGAAYGQILNKA